jgi:hypothetical protein
MEPVLETCATGGVGRAIVPGDVIRASVSEMLSGTLTFGES